MARRRIRRRKVEASRLRREFDQLVDGLNTYAQRAPLVTGERPNFAIPIGARLTREWFDEGSVYVKLTFWEQFRKLSQEMYVCTDGRHLFKLDANGEALVENVRPTSKFSYGTNPESLASFSAKQEARPELVPA